MTQKAWAAVAVLGALVIVMVVAAVRLLPSHHHEASARPPTSSAADGQAPPPAPNSASQSGPQASDSNGADGNGDGNVVAGGEVDSAHQVMQSYLESLGSYTSADRQPSWQQDALNFTDGNPAIRAFTKLPTGHAWATCVATHCSSRSTAHVLRDTATTDVAGADGGPQVVSYVDVATTLTARGSKPDTQHTQFTVTTNQESDGWKVTGCSFAGVGDTGSNGDGP
ncbi:MAG TPA: hypothetical protein VHX59_26195 [Mycobacteriales bacterium]|jgi:hypothetical protein|nr:hypothetical protein [Mycobacteriales bacterium]